MKDTRLFVGNLSYNTTQNDLQDAFSEAGVVTSVSLMIDKFSGKSRGFAFVEMASVAEAAKAIELFHGKPLHKRALTVNIARPREERTNHFRGGAGNGAEGNGRFRGSSASM